MSDPVAEFVELGKAIARDNPSMTYEETVAETVRRHPSAYAALLALCRQKPMDSLLSSPADRTRFAGLVALCRQKHPRESIEQTIERAREVDPALYHRVTGQPPAQKADPYGLDELFRRKFQREHAAALRDKAEAKAAAQAAVAEAQAKVQVFTAEQAAIEQKLAWNEGERLLRAAAVDEDDDEARAVAGTPYCISVPLSRAELEAGDVEACRAPLTRDEAVARLRAAEAKRAKAMPGYPTGRTA